MYFSRFALASALALPLAYGATGLFSYDPDHENGPDNWANLAIDGNVCDGKKNSPIAVETRGCDRFEDYSFVHGSCTTNNLKYELTNTGVKASYPGIQQCQHPSVKIPGIDGEYRALQLHIHTSSEHTIDGEFFGAELHTVHQEIDGDRYAVVGMMIQPSANAKNKLFQELLDSWAAVMESNEEECALSRGNGRQLETSVRSLEGNSTSLFSPYMLVPEGATYYHYDGGLTTPPCSEVVWWNLADKPVSVTPAQYNQLVQQVLDYTNIATCTPGTNAGPAGSTSRPVQPLNGRSLERICPKGFVEEESESTSSAAFMSMMGATAVAGAALLF